MRDVTQTITANAWELIISTHTSHAGRDTELLAQKQKLLQFLLTRPMRDVTSLIINEIRSILISTHTSHAGRDVQRDPGGDGGSGFLLTRPMRDVTIKQQLYDYIAVDFYSHVPCGT